ncbi:MAG: site-specific integrase [Cyanobacteria bacterium REEB65]|nr:site-specific integrase [Cyanobacteria bacterium REEB65]
MDRAINRDTDWLQPGGTMMGTRRGNHEGTKPYLRADGRWECKIMVGYSPDGKRIRKTVLGKTKAAVVEKSNEAKVKVATRQILPTTEKSRTLVSEYLMQWLETVVKPGRAPKTYYSYHGVCKNYLLPTLGGLRLDRVSAMNIQATMAGLKAKELSPQTMRGAFAVLQSALSQAVRWDLIQFNPCSKAERPRVPKKSRPHWNAEEVRKFLAAARDDRFGPLYVVALATGMRFGEILGLRWENVDMNGGIIHIAQQLCEVGGDRIEGPPKKDSIRSVFLPPAAIAALKMQKEKLEAEELGASHWVFPDTKGGPVRQSNLTRRSFYPIIKRAGIKKITFHGMRHTFATLAIGEAQIDIKTVQELLGHADASLTLRIYSHALPGNKRAAAAKIEALLVPSWEPALSKQ